MSTRATTSHRHVADVAEVLPMTRPTRLRRLRGLLTREQAEEDGVFRPVRLPMWVDLGISAAIIVVMAAAFVGFFVWLAQTPGALMARRQRTTQQSDIAKAFGGRSGFVSEELDRGDKPPEDMSRAERTLAWWQWSDSSNHYEDHADDDWVRLNRLVPSAEALVAIGIVLFFVGGSASFIAFLALTR